MWLGEYSKCYPREATHRNSMDLGGQHNHGIGVHSTWAAKGYTDISQVPQAGSIAGAAP